MHPCWKKSINFFPSKNCTRLNFLILCIIIIIIIIIILLNTIYAAGQRLNIEHKAVLRII